jgi:hypothetical protein
MNRRKVQVVCRRALPVSQLGKIADRHLNGLPLGQFTRFAGISVSRLWEGERLSGYSRADGSEPLSALGSAVIGGVNHAFLDPVADRLQLPLRLLPRRRLLGPRHILNQEEERSNSYYRICERLDQLIPRVTVAGAS